MKKEVIVRLHASFEELVQHNETGNEFWLARDLQELLGYARWENFAKVTDKARIACKGSGHEPEDHFLDVTKMVDLGSGATRSIDDVALTRYACYLIAQNGDPGKDAIAFAQTYFALQTRKQELIEQRIAEVERLSARKKLTLSEKELSGIIYERVGDQMSFARIRSKGDVALFGGLTTQDMKNKLGVPDSRPLADFLPTITIKAKDFANEITNFNIKRDGLSDEPTISREHVKNNKDVRDLLGQRGIRPELLGVLPQQEYDRFSRNPQNRSIPKALLKLFSDIPLDASGDVFGQIYEYFLGNFAMSEGQGGGEFFTPRSVVRLMVEIIEPHGGKVFDPACGSGGMFVQSAQFIEQHRQDAAQDLDVYVYGTEKTLETVKLVDEHPKVLVQDWFKDNQTQKQVRSEIERVLDEGLPETYERALFKQKCDNVFELVVDYASRGRKWAA